VPMDLPAGTVEVGDNAYLFPSPAGMGVTDCFIVAHGGTPSIRERRFTVPAGCSVNFFIDHNQAHKMALGPIQGFKAISGRNQGRAPPIEPGRHFAAGVASRDYILSKAVGTHYKAEPDQNTYIGINRALNELQGAHAGLKWLPHYISIRNRTSVFCDTNIWLSKLIQQVRAANPAIVNFYCSHCRGLIDAKIEARCIGTAGGQAYQ